MAGQKNKVGGSKKIKVRRLKNNVRGLQTQGIKKQGGKSKKNEGRSERNKVGGLNNKGPVYFDKISCTCAAQHYLYNNRAKLLVSTVFSEHYKPPTRLYWCVQKQRIPYTQKWQS